MADNDTGNRVPALEKGLDILEVLAAEKGGLLQKDVASKVGRSVSEVFRVLSALEARGYIARDEVKGTYVLTLRLFELAHIHPPTRRLIEVATAQMDELSALIWCSCHLVTPHQDRLMVVAQAQPDALLMGWSVKVGASFPMSRKYASARTIAAHQRSDVKGLMIERMVREEPDLDLSSLQDSLEHIRENGVEISESAIAAGVTDISCPILNHLGFAVGALTVPKVGNLPDSRLSMNQIVDEIRRTTNTISKAIGGPGRLAHSA